MASILIIHLDGQTLVTIRLFINLMDMIKFYALQILLLIEIICFDFVTLCHDANSRRLFRIMASRTFSSSMSSTDCIELLKAMSRDCDYRYKIKIPVPSSDEVDALLKNRHNGWSVNRGDSSFLISLSLSLKTNGLIQLTMTVESLQVRRHFGAHIDTINDIEVNVNDF